MFHSPIPRPLAVSHPNEEVPPVIFIGGGSSPTSGLIAAQQRSEREPIALHGNRLTKCLGNRRHDVHILGESIDGRTVVLGNAWIADDSDDVVTLLEESEFLLESVVTELFAVVCGEDDHRVVPFATRFQCIEHTTELFIHVADHSVVLSAHVAHAFLGVRRLCRGNLQCEVVEWMTLVVRSNGQLDVIW